MKSKKKMLLALGAMSAAAIGAGATSTFAWYTANANAKVNAAAATGNLTSTASSISAGTFTVNFTVTPADSELELSHVATAAEASSGLAGIATVAEGDLVYGVINNGAATMRKCAAASNFISSYSITAAWATTPSDPADVAYLGNKKFTITLGVTGNAKFLTEDDDLTGQSNRTSATAVVHIAANMGLTVDTIDYAYVHIEPTSISASETGTVGAVTVTEASDVTLVADA